MNKLKSLIAVASLLVMLAALAACGKKPWKQNTQTPENTDGTVSTAQPTENTTEPTTQGQTPDSGTSVGADRPDISSDTEVGSDREELGGQSNSGTATPTEKPTEPNSSTNTGLSMNYQQYMALSGAAQQEFYDQHFADDPLGFASWFQKIKAEYDSGRVEIEATGPIDIGDYINP